MITASEILKGKQCPANLQANLDELLRRVNILRGIYGKPMIVNSGYRTREENTRIGGATNSAHLYCQAVDFRDYSRDLSNWCLANQSVLEECQLWAELPSSTPTWLHLQSRPAKHRVFEP